MSHNGGTQGMAVSNYKADEKEASRNRKKLMAIIKKPENVICMDCPAKRACPFLAGWSVRDGGSGQSVRCISVVLWALTPPPALAHVLS